MQREAMMPRGGKRDGAGRTSSACSATTGVTPFGRPIALKIGQRCEVLWREAYDKGDVAGNALERCEVTART